MAIQDLLEVDRLTVQPLIRDLADDFKNTLPAFFRAHEFVPFGCTRRSDACRHYVYCFVAPVRALNVERVPEILAREI